MSAPLLPVSFTSRICLELKEKRKGVEENAEEGQVGWCLWKGSVERILNPRGAEDFPPLCHPQC